MIRIVIDIRSDRKGKAIVDVRTETFDDRDEVTDAVHDAWHGLCGAISREMRKNGSPSFDCLKARGATQ